MDAAQLQEVLARIQLEYLEMPNLKLTLPPARRLWSLPAEWCDAALDLLVLSGFLRRTGDGLFLRRGLGRRSGGRDSSENTEARKSPVGPERSDDRSSPSEDADAAGDGVVGRETILPSRCPSPAPLT